MLKRTFRKSNLFHNTYNREESADEKKIIVLGNESTCANNILVEINGNHSNLSKQVSVVHILRQKHDQKYDYSLLHTYKK